MKNTKNTTKKLIALSISMTAIPFSAFSMESEPSNTDNQQVAWVIKEDDDQADALSLDSSSEFNKCNFDNIQVDPNMNTTWSDTAKIAKRAGGAAIVLYSLSKLTEWYVGHDIYIEF